ncbi:MAG: DUF2911 domain-containing protein [Bacteroidota bacterium]
MKKLFTAAMLLLTFSAWAQLTLPPSGNNQKAKVTQWIGPVEVSIAYSSPNVTAPNGTDRTGHIWGELVHYGFIDQGFGTSKAAPWRAGANENTVISFSHPVKIDGKEVPAGAYGLFLAVEKDGPWMWILSKNSTSWGSYFYNPSEDVVRVAATPQDAPFTQFLTYGFEGRNPNNATAYLQWENKKVAFKIDVPNVNDLYLAGIRNELRSSPGFEHQAWMQAAQFCVNNNINLEEALTWANAAINMPFIGQENFNTLQTKAMVLTALKRHSEANALMDKAIKLPTATVQAVHQYGRALLNQGENKKALEVFQYNFKAHPEEKFTTYVGLARGYAANNNTKEAIKNWELAIKNIPENQKANIAFYEGELKKLKDGK